MTGTETKITLDDIRKVAIAISGLGLEDWDLLDEPDRESFMLQALNAMFTQEEQGQMIGALLGA